MIPEHYLHVILGAMPGAALGYLAAAIICARRNRRLSAEEWRAAMKYYTWAKDHPHQ